MADVTRHRNFGWLMVARIAVEATAAYFITAAIMHYGVQSTAIGRKLIALQPEVAAASLSLSVLVLWMGVTLVFGRIFCSTLCPLGALLDLMGRGRLDGRPFRFVRGSMPLRLSALALCGILLVVLRPDTPPPFFPESLYSHLVTTFSSMEVSAATAVAVAVTVALAISAIKRGRIVCNTLCPVGIVLGLLSRRPVFRIDIDTDRCTQCRRCSDVCKAQCIDLQDHVVDTSRCVVCFDCLAQCHDDAISYTPSRHILSTPMLIPTKKTATSCSDNNETIS